MAYSSHCNIYALHPRAVSALLTLLLHVCCYITHLWSYCMLSLAASDVHVTFQKASLPPLHPPAGTPNLPFSSRGNEYCPPPPHSFLFREGQGRSRCQTSTLYTFSVFKYQLFHMSWVTWNYSEPQRAVWKWLFRAKLLKCSAWSTTCKPHLPEDCKDMLEVTRLWCRCRCIHSQIREATFNCFTYDVLYWNQSRRNQVKVKQTDCVFDN